MMDGMLDRRGDDPIPAVHLVVDAVTENIEHRIVRFAGPAGEHDPSVGAVDQRSDLLAGDLNDHLGITAQSVHAGRVSIQRLRLVDRLADGLIHLGSPVIIEIHNSFWHR
jgi:hypothetical protein